MLKGSKLNPKKIFSCRIIYSSLKSTSALSKHIIRNWIILSAGRLNEGCYSTSSVPHLAWSLTHYAYSTNVCTIQHISVTFSDDSLLGKKNPFIERMARFPEIV